MATINNTHDIWTSEVVGPIVAHYYKALDLLHMSGYRPLQRALRQHVTRYNMIDRQIFAKGLLPTVLLDLNNLSELTLDVPHVRLLSFIRDDKGCRGKWQDAVSVIARLNPDLRKLRLLFPSYTDLNDITFEFLTQRDKVMDMIYVVRLIETISRRYQHLDDLQIDTEVDITTTGVLLRQYNTRSNRSNGIHFSCTAIDIASICIEFAIYTNVPHAGQIVQVTSS